MNEGCDGNFKLKIREIALEQILVCAKSVAYSASASGTYITTCLFPRLGIADEMSKKTKKFLVKEWD